MVWHADAADAVFSCPGHKPLIVKTAASGGTAAAESGSGCLSSLSFALSLAAWSTVVADPAGGSTGSVWPHARLNGSKRHNSESLRMSWILRKMFWREFSTILAYPVASSHGTGLQFPSS